MLSLSFISWARPKHIPICPWDPGQMSALTRRLGISPNELNDAIIETGSLDLQYIKAYIKRKRYRLVFIKKLKALTTF